MEVTLGTLLTVFAISGAFILGALFALHRQLFNMQRQLLNGINEGLNGLERRLSDKIEGVNERINVVDNHITRIDTVLENQEAKLTEHAKEQKETDNRVTKLETQLTPTTG